MTVFLVAGIRRGRKLRFSMQVVEDHVHVVPLALEFKMDPVLYLDAIVVKVFVANMAIAGKAFMGNREPEWLPM